MCPGCRLTLFNTNTDYLCSTSSLQSQADVVLHLDYFFAGRRRGIRRDASSVLSSIARLPLQLTLPDPTAVGLPAQLSPLGKKPSLRGPIALQASTSTPAALGHSIGEGLKSDGR